MDDFVPPVPTGRPGESAGIERQRRSSSIRSSRFFRSPVRRTVNLNAPGFAFLSIGAFAYIDRGRFEGQPTDCAATTYQITPFWLLPFRAGTAKLKFDGFMDVIGKHANCAAMVLTQPRLALDFSVFWQKPGRAYVGVDFSYSYNKYGISGLEHKVLLPVVVWVL